MFPITFNQFLLWGHWKPSNRNLPVGEVKGRLPSHLGVMAAGMELHWAGHIGPGGACDWKAPTEFPAGTVSLRGWDGWDGDGWDGWGILGVTHLFLISYKSTCSEKMHFFCQLWCSFSCSWGSHCRKKRERERYIYIYICPLNFNWVSSGLLEMFLGWRGWCGVFLSFGILSWQTTSRIHGISCLTHTLPSVSCEHTRIQGYKGWPFDILRQCFIYEEYPLAITGF